MNSENQKSNSFNKVNALLLANIVLIFVYIWFRSCDNPTVKKTITVEAPEVKGKFEAVKPEQVVISDKKTANMQKAFGQNLSKKELEYWKTEAERLFKENQEMDQAFKNANDSLQQLLYKKAISINAFSHNFNNDTLSATVKGLVRGEIQNIALDYKIKSRKIEIPNPKEVKFRMLGGVEVGNTKEFNDFSVKANVGFQLGSGAILNFSADTQKRFYVGYSVPIFTIKR
jgi:hypothetical protein